MSKKMDKRIEFDNILEECLEKVIKGEDINTVLALYPEYAKELEPLLRTALDTRMAVAIEPRPEFRQRAALEFQKAIREMPVKEKASAGVSRWRLAWVVPVSVFAALLLAGTGTVAAASNSLPGDSLYSVKLASESVQLALTPSSLGKAELYSKFNDNRVDEIVKMAEKGDAEQVVELTDSMASNMAAIDELTGGNEKMLSAEFGMMSASTDASAPPETDSAETNTVMTAPQATWLPDQTTVATTTAAPTTTATPTTTITTAATITPVTTSAPLPPSAEVGPGILRHSSGQQDRNNQVKDARVNGKDDGNTKEENLQNLLTDKQQNALRILLREYEKASDELKPKIHKAIEVILEGYNTSISNLAQ